MSKLLSAPGSKPKVFSRVDTAVSCARSTSDCIYRRYCEYSQYFEIQYCGYFRIRSVSGFGTTVDTPCASSISGLFYAGTASRGSISPGGTMSTANTRIIKILPACRVFSEYEVYCDHLCTFQTISSPLLGRKHPQIVPRVGVGAQTWSKLLSGGGATGVLTVRVLAVFLEYLLQVLAVFPG